jgi:branched-subunit amino acid aminotransferase/4-amino-4-deoxychorismate lyase
VRVELDGRPVDAETLWSTTSRFGHFTAMQVRSGRTRGLALHLRRLEAANRELFDAPLDGERVRGLIRHALGDVEDASVRVYVHEADPEPAIVVTVRDPGGVTSPQRLMSVRYQRPDAHLKHLATGQAYYLRLAQRSAFDDALLTADDGLVSETAIANVGFLDSDGIVWPDAPLLAGITMQLLERELPSRRARVRLEDIASFEGAFLSNARGVAVVSDVDGATLRAGAPRLQAVADAYDAVAWDRL